MQASPHITARGPVASGSGAVPVASQPTFGESARCIIQRVEVEEAHMTAALGRVGRELIASRSTAAILHRLCRLVIDVLECDCSHTFVRRATDDAYVPVCGDGDTAAQWNSIRRLRLAPERISILLSRLNRDGIAQVTYAQSQELLPATTLADCDLHVCLCMGLRHGPEIVGIQTAGYRRRSQPFSLLQQRVAVGVAGLASLALQHARLVETLAAANGIKADFRSAVSAASRGPAVRKGYASRQSGRGPAHPRRRGATLRER